MISGVVRLGKPSKKAVFSMTDSAITKIKELMIKEGEKCQGLRLGVKQRGCSGLQYTLDFTSQPPNKLDEVVTDKGITIVVDSKALMSVIGTEMDYIEEPIKKEFIFINPNATNTCGCGESFTVKDPVIQFSNSSSSNNILNNNPIKHL
ncbi:iron-sulfur cluster assembly 1 like protein [Cavenderia fasciculata]|uniref:Iron-sulfur cluster assembly 1 like protein n=1 Tax=Cavenderia fasciculata TaxID=261658 RepID=F4Q6F7_CACFS|nr:iron-sulfur cluster assembly 1 like protein [Cavenderia fasciculata]EGG16467.1 iron-sulfur cluster assembly 1 like protein [Cavenderia fasciculata]|eukprot:XP_004354867.1 iron-sulfur cluster assembly 1 like protein [Cavenderia fasciculata]